LIVSAMMMLVVVASQTTAEAGAKKNPKHNVSINSVAGSTSGPKQRKIRAIDFYGHHRNFYRIRKR
jgi:hypothetical protein